MLGAVKLKELWSWFASGKHPVARDFVRLGTEDPILRAFADWADAGYQQLAKTRANGPEYLSWRFWARGAKKESLICGLGRQSSDALGRPYPLMIVGAGPLKGWESNWDLLPYALEDIWSQIEYLASGRHADLEQLREGLNRIKTPLCDWLALANRRATAGGIGGSAHLARDPHAMSRYVQSLQSRGETFVLLTTAAGSDPLLLAGYWNWALKAHLAGVPNAVFLGGNPDKSFLVVFNRSLNSPDFVRLWSVATW